MFYSMYLSSKWPFTTSHRPIEEVVAYTCRASQLSNQPYNLPPKSHTALTNLPNRPLRTPPLVLAALRALPNPTGPLLQSPRQQPRVQHRRALQISGSGPRRRRNKGFHDLPQLQRQRRHVSWPTSRQRWRSARLTCSHWRRQSNDSQLSQLDDRE